MMDESDSRSSTFPTNRLAQLELSIIKPQSKSSLRMRWYILACAAMGMMGVYYS